MLTGLLARKFAERKPGFDIESRTADIAWLYTL